MEQIDLFNLPSEYNPSAETDNSLTEKDNSKKGCQPFLHQERNLEKVTFTHEVKNLKK